MCAASLVLSLKALADRNPRRYLKENPMDRRKPSLVSALTSASLAASLCVGELLPDRTRAQSQKQTKANSQQGAYPTLALYAHDLTALARTGRLDRTHAHTAQVEQLIRLLAQDAQHNPVLTGETGAGKAALVIGLAERIAAGDVPAELRDRRVFSLDLTALLASAQDSRAVEQRMRAVLDEATRVEAILFVDNLPALVGTGAAHGTQVAAMFKAALAQGRLRVVGTTTPGAYHDFIQPDEALARLCRELRVDDAATGAANARVARHKVAEEFEGNKISEDLRELMQQAKSADERVGVILQTDDVRNRELAALFARYGVEVNARMAQLGALKVDVPVS